MRITDLFELEKSSIARGIPILGSAKGEWLLNEVMDLKPKKILELGTANGYSGCILGSSGAELTSIEKNPILAKDAELNFKKYNIAARVIVGDGVLEIKKLSGFFDVIFIDFAKHKYLSVLDDCIRLTKSGSLIIADNISMEGCQDFKEAVLSHPLLKTQIVDIKDGLSVSLRL